MTIGGYSCGSDLPITLPSPVHISLPTERLYRNGQDTNVIYSRMGGAESEPITWIKQE